MDRQKTVLSVQHEIAALWQIVTKTVERMDILEDRLGQVDVDQDDDDDETNEGDETVGGRCGKGSSHVGTRNGRMCDLFKVHKDPSVGKMNSIQVLQYIVKQLTMANGNEPIPLMDYFHELVAAAEVPFSSVVTHGTRGKAKKAKYTSQQLKDHIGGSLFVSFLNYLIQTGLLSVGMSKEQVDGYPLFIMYDTIKIQYDWNITIDGYGILKISWQCYGLICSPQQEEDDDDQLASEEQKHRFIQPTTTLSSPIIIPSNDMTLKYGLRDGKYEHVLQLIAEMLSIIDTHSLPVSVQYIAVALSPSSPAHAPPPAPAPVLVPCCC